MKNNLIAVLLGSVILFVWGFVSWTILPWHNSVSNKFGDESAVAQVLKSNAKTPGIYYLPYAQEDHKTGEATAFVNILPNGLEMNMSKMMGVAMIGQILSALMVLLLLRQTSGLSYWNKVGFVSLVGLTIGFVSHFPYWNWFEFSSAYILVTILDIIIAWILAGLVMAKFAQTKTI